MKIVLLLLLLSLASSTALPARRGFDLLGALSKATKGTGLGTTLEIINAFSKVDKLVKDIKGMVPKMNKALNESITDVTTTIDKVLDNIGQAIDPATKTRRSFDLLGALSKATKGTGLGTTLEVINAFSKVDKLIKDVKNILPKVHTALSESITDVTTTIDNVLDNLGQAIDPATKS